MPLFRRNKRPETIPYDPGVRQPAVRRSICTGEMTVGFIDMATGKFHEYMLARDRAALEDFCRATGVDVETIRTIY